MHGNPAPALRRQARGLVQHDDGFIAVEDHRLEVADLVRIHGHHMAHLRHLFRWRDFGHHHDVAGGEMRAGFGSLAVHADFPRPQKSLNDALGQAFHLAAQKAVEPRAGFGFGDGKILDHPALSRSLAQ